MVCASGSHHCLFLDSLASVWSCGHNGHGELGLGHATNKRTPEKIDNLPPIITISAGGNAVCLLMQMEVFGAVDTINIDWDWGT